jgi:hypothetical protein
MKWLGPFGVIFGAAFLAWLLTELRGRNMRPDVGNGTMILLIPTGLLVGWTVKSVTGNYSMLVMVALGVVLAVVTEVSRMF